MKTHFNILSASFPQLDSLSLINKGNYLSIMKHNENFEQLLNKLDETDYIGLGNPNAKILFIGKEPKGELGSELEHGCVKHWNSGIDYSRRYEPGKELRHLGRTWQRYQKLYNTITTKLGCNKLQNSKYEITFVEDVFTTELSQFPAPDTKKAKGILEFKSKLAERKENFFATDFLKEFQIVFIFASDPKYIEVHQGEVCKLFEVSYVPTEEVEKFLDKKLEKSIWVHKGITPSGKPKIVIHTRQLTNHAGIMKLIECLGDLVVNFVNQYNIELNEEHRNSMVLEN